MEGSEMATSEKAELMRSMNHEIALLAADSAPVAGDRWSFLCECDAADCRQCVELELAEYREISADPYAAVLAASHAAVSRSQRARREAERAMDSSRAL